jgi:hypothetical protein
MPPLSHDKKCNELDSLISPREIPPRSQAEVQQKRAEQIKFALAAKAFDEGFSGI